MPSLRLLVLPLVIALAAGASGCGSDVFDDPDTVALVAGKPVTKQQFDRWANVNAHSWGMGKDFGPPDYKGCVEAMRKRSPQTQAAQLKSSCEQQYKQLKDQTMQFLISAAWTEREAERLKIKPTEKEISQRIKAIRQQLTATSRETSADKAMAKAGLDETAIKEQARIEVLNQAIRQRSFDRPVKAPTASQLKRFYRQNKRQFARPEARTLLVLSAATEKQAKAARKALDDGRRWKQVYTRYNTKPLTGSPDGRLPGIPRKALPPKVDRVVFSIPTGTLFGPLPSGSGSWVVGRVTEKITARRAPAFSKIRGQVKASWEVQQKQKYVERETKALRERWVKQTRCKKDYLTDGCSEYRPQTQTIAVNKQP